MKLLKGWSPYMISAMNELTVLKEPQNPDDSPLRKSEIGESWITRLDEIRLRKQINNIKWNQYMKL